MDSDEESQSISGIEIPPNSPTPVIEPTLRKLMGEAKQRVHDDAKKNGFQVQAWRGIDEHRAGEGRETYNERRKRERREKAIAETDEPPRAYMKGMPPEHRKAQLADARARYSERRTPEQVAEDKEKKRLSAIEYRAKVKAREKAQAEANLPEGFGKF